MRTHRGRVRFSDAGDSPHSAATLASLRVGDWLPAVAPGFHRTSFSLTSSEGGWTDYVMVERETWKPLPAPPSGV